MATFSLVQGAGTAAGPGSRAGRPGATWHVVAPVRLHATRRCSKCLR